MNTQSDLLTDSLPHVMVRFVYREDGTPLGFIAIHRGTKEHPAFGATRVFDYPDVASASYDALRLAQFMSYKNALAGSQYGGGKGVIMMNKEEQRDPDRRKGLFRRYVDEVNNLGGAFVTGADVGVSMEDVRFMREYSPYIVGVSRDPVLHTARGVIAGLNAALQFRFGDTDLSRYSYSILGVGKVGWALLSYLSTLGARIVVADIDPHVIERVRTAFPETEIVSPDELLKQRVDVFLPCAMGGILNEQSIASLPVEIIVGAANNQLSETAIGDKLHEQNILYVPDYVANGGGVISVINEYEQRSDDELNAQVSRIEDNVFAILERSKEQNMPTHRIADMIAEERLRALFPRN